MTPKNPDLAPNTLDAENYVRWNEQSVPDVARFFMYAPSTCINQLRQLLLEEGFELVFQPAQQIFFPSPEL